MTQYVPGWICKKAVTARCTKAPDSAGITPIASRPYAWRWIASTAFSTSCTPLKMRSTSA